MEGLNAIWRFHALADSLAHKLAHFTHKTRRHPRRGYMVFVLVAKTTFHSFAALTRKISFLPLRT